MWLDCRNLGLPDADLPAFFAREAGVALTAGAPFGDSGAGFMRMNLAIPRPLVRQALDRLEAAVERHRLP
jgi:cystathionine beta-lyase